MAQFTTLAARAVVLPASDVDTDQIIPARFLKVTDKAGLGDSLFADWRYPPDGSPRPDFVLNQPEHQGAAILVAGDNFGCGSSREHAPWALTGFGFRAVVTTSFADIFRNNALKNGLLPGGRGRCHARELLDLLRKEPQADPRHRPRGADPDAAQRQGVTFPIDPFSKTCLLNGVDELGYILGFSRPIAAYEARPTGAPA